MHVHIGNAGLASLREDENFTALKLVTELSMIELAGVLQREVGLISSGDMEHVWLSQAWLRTQGAAKGEEWLVRFDQMMAYAARKGWMSADSASVRAHVEYLAAS